jgi:putative ABC transport system permease protein
MDAFWHDVKHAVRTLVKRPGFTLGAAVVFALGIGANGAIFTLVDAALIRPVPFERPAQLCMLWEAPPGFPYNRVSPLNFLDWTEQNRAFSGMAAVVGGSRTLTAASGAAERIAGQAVTSSFFDVLGVKPIAGRTFVRDDAANAARLVILGERFWRTRYGGDPALVGQTIVLDGEPAAVIGIVPADFQILFRSDLWTLFVPRRSPEQRRMHYLQVIGRLRPGVTLDQARADMRAVADAIARVAPETNQSWTVNVEPLDRALVTSDVRTTTLALAGVVAFVLLMSCANVANLLLARGLSRGREIAVRSALGASRGRILRQLLIENMLLAAIGGAAGLALAWAIVAVAPSVMPEDTLPASMSLAFNGRLVAFATALSCATGVVCGLAPAQRLGRSTWPAVVASRPAPAAASAPRSPSSKWRRRYCSCRGPGCCSGRSSSSTASIPAIGRIAC